MFRVRVKPHLVDTYKETGAKPDYFPSINSPLDLLLGGHEVWARYSNKNPNYIKVADDNVVMFKGNLHRLEGYMLDAKDCVILLDEHMDNRRVNDV